MFTVPELPYEYGALKVAISEDIMRLHHDKHHQAYVDKLNSAVATDPTLTNRSVEDLLSNIDSLPEAIQSAVRNHGGGHYNHSLFWKWMSPQGGGEPSGELAEKLIEKYGSFQSFVDEFKAKSLTVFGSGWTWLQPDMSIITTSNQDTPIAMGLQEPLLGLDVWEHAYYLDYKNKRDDYINAWWNVVDWDFVSSRLNSAK